MADYREISQEYAKQGINAAFLLNGGAAIALLSQAAALKEQALGASIATPMLIWASGTGLAAITWVIGFISTRYVDKSEREKELEKAHLSTSDTWMFAGIAAVIGSILLFGIGCVDLANSF